MLGQSQRRKLLNVAYIHRIKMARAHPPLQMSQGSQHVPSLAVLAAIMLRLRNEPELGGGTIDPQDRT